MGLFDKRKKGKTAGEKETAAKTFEDMFSW